MLSFSATRVVTVLLIALVLSLAAGGIAVPHGTWAAATGGSGGGVGGSGGATGGGGGGVGGEPGLPSRYLSQVYIWFMGFVGVAALFAFVVGGVTWMFSTTITSTATARKWIVNGVYGIVIAAGSFLLLNTINPDLIRHGFDINRVIDQVLPVSP